MTAAVSPETKLVMIDGCPGGLVVLSLLPSVVWLVLIVAEPSVLGISDMERMIKTAALWNKSSGMCQ